MCSRDLQYDMVPGVNSAVLDTEKLAKGVELVLCSYHNKMKVLKMSFGV